MVEDLIWYHMSEEGRKLGIWNQGGVLTLRKDCRQKRPAAKFAGRFPYNLRLIVKIGPAPYPDGHWRAPRGSSRGRGKLPNHPPEQPV